MCVKVAAFVSRGKPKTTSKSGWSKVVPPSWRSWAAGAVGRTKRVREDA